MRGQGPKGSRATLCVAARQGWGDRELSMVATGRPGTRRTWRGGLGGWAGTKGAWWPGDPSPPSVAAAALPPTWAAVVPVCAAVRAAAVPMSPPQPRSAPPAPPAGTRARALAAQGHRQARPGCPSAAGGASRALGIRTSTPTQSTWLPAPQGTRVGDRTHHVRSWSHGGRCLGVIQTAKGRAEDGVCVVQVGLARR